MESFLDCRAIPRHRWAHWMLDDNFRSHYLILAFDRYWAKLEQMHMRSQQALRFLLMLASPNVNGLLALDQLEIPDDSSSSLFENSELINKIPTCDSLSSRLEAGDHGFCIKEVSPTVHTLWSVHKQLERITLVSYTNTVRTKYILFPQSSWITHQALSAAAENRNWREHYLTSEQLQNSPTLSLFLPPVARREAQIEIRNGVEGIAGTPILYWNLAKDTDEDEE